MSNCANCIHKEVCKYYQDNSIAKSVRKKPKQCCNHFADISEMIKPPCKIGDAVYWVDETALLYIGDKNIGTYKISGIALKSDGFYIIDECDNLEKIGSQYALLTKEDAESKLAELKEK